jgi:hypothetical protein
MEKVMSKETNIYIIRPDHGRLTKLIERAREREGDATRPYLNRLEEELERAEVVEQRDIPTSPAGTSAPRRRESPSASASRHRWPPTLRSRRYAVARSSGCRARRRWRASNVPY